MRSLIHRRQLLLSVVSAAAGVIVAGSVIAAPKIYKYRCPKCKLAQEHGQPGATKCPNDGKTMA